MMMTEKIVMMMKTVTMMMKNMMMMMISTEEEMYGRSADGKEEFKLPTGSRPFVSCKHHHHHYHDHYHHHYRHYHEHDHRRHQHHHCIVDIIAISDEAKADLQSHTGIGGTSSVLRSFVKVRLQQLASR